MEHAALAAPLKTFQNLSALALSLLGKLHHIGIDKVIPPQSGAEEKTDARRKLGKSVS